VAQSRVEEAQVALTYTMKNASAQTGLSVRKLYDEISAGRLKSATVGRRRLVDAESLKQLVTQGVPCNAPREPQPKTTTRRKKTAAQA
jgi:excisionase family DNA binding protein